MRKFIFTLAISLLPVFASAATYTVNTAGEDYNTIDACVDAAPDPTTEDHICEIYDDQGTLSGWTVSDSGSSDGWIIVRAATGESPTLSSGINFGDEDYIQVEGLYINGSLTDDGSGSSSYIKIIDNTIDGTGSDHIVLEANHVLISGNTFTDNQSEDVIRQFGQYWVVRNNYWANETDAENQHMDFWQSWCESGRTTPASYVLLENNEVLSISGGNAHFSLINGTSGCNAGPQYHIYRYNKIYDIPTRAIWMDANDEHSDTGLSSIYNNTFSYCNGGSGFLSWEDYSCSMSGTDSSFGINNIHANSMDQSNATGFSPGSNWSQSYNLYYDSNSTMTFSGAASTETGAVKNQNPNIANPANNDFSINSNSPAYDAGGHLTTVTSVDGSGATFNVIASQFFCDGWGVADADWICVGQTVSVADCVQISSINYSTNAITLVSSISWESGDKVWLYKDSDGTQVLYGDAPDVGAYEYDSGDTTPPAMSNPLPSGGQACDTNPLLVDLEITTNEDATCKFDTSDTTYDLMANFFSSTGGTAHLDYESLACNAAYTYYVRCKDTADNKNTTSETISFTIDKQLVPITFSGGGGAGASSK